MSRSILPNYFSHFNLFWRCYSITLSSWRFLTPQFLKLLTMKYEKGTSICVLTVVNFLVYTPYASQWTPWYGKLIFYVYIVREFAMQKKIKVIISEFRYWMKAVVTFIIYQLEYWSKINTWTSVKYYTQHNNIILPKSR